MPTWRKGIAAVAECPNVVVKLGGIGMPRTGFDWHLRNKPIGSEELAESMKPLLTYCIDQFGPERCMFESNFPVDKVGYSYTVLFNAFKRLSAGYSPPSAPPCSTTPPPGSTASTFSIAIVPVIARPACS